MVDIEVDIKHCIDTLQNSGTILYPTDTVWGIGCNAQDETAVDKIFKIKHRPKEKSMIILLADAKDIIQYVATPHPDIIAIVEAFEEPTTVIFDNAIGLADNVINSDGSVGIRVTTDPFCKALIKRCKLPLVSTSANISGAATATTFSAIANDIINGVDYVVKYKQHDNSTRQPSSIVKITDEGDVIYIRK